MKYRRRLLSLLIPLFCAAPAAAEGLFLAEGGLDLSLEGEWDRPLMTGRLGIDLFPYSFETVTTEKGRVWHGLALNIGRTLESDPEEWAAIRYMRGGRDGRMGFGKAIGLGWRWGQRRGLGLVMDSSLMDVAFGGRFRLEAMYDFRQREPAVFLSFMVVVGEILPWTQRKMTRAEDIPYHDPQWGF